MTVQCFGYYYSGEAEQFSFYRIPKALFTDMRFQSLSIEGKILYGLMLDRMGLSKKNGWLDRAGRVYINFKLEDAIQLLCLSKNKVIKVYKELIEIGLIERVKQGQGRPARIYVKNFVVKDSGASPMMTQPLYSHSGKSRQTTGPVVDLPCEDTRGAREGSTDFPEKEVKSSLSGETRLPRLGGADFPDMNRNNTDYSNTEINYTDLSIHPCEASGYREAERVQGKEDADRYDFYRKRIRENIDYEYLRQRYRADIDIIDGYVDLMVDVCCSRKEYVPINREQVPTTEVKRRFLKLNSEHILYVLDMMKDNTSSIDNIKNYTQTVLFNALSTMAQYYASKVAHDMAEDLS